jgi:hypothetical protein
MTRVGISTFAFAAALAATAEANAADYKGDRVHDVAGIGEDLANASNASGQSVGISLTGTGEEAVSWSPSGAGTVLHDVGGDTASEALAVNASGQSAGDSFTPTGAQDAVLVGFGGRNGAAGCRRTRDQQGSCDQRGKVERRTIDADRAGLRSACGDRDILEAVALNRQAGARTAAGDRHGERAAGLPYERVAASRRILELGESGEPQPVERSPACPEISTLFRLGAGAIAVAGRDATSTSR